MTRLSWRGEHLALDQPALIDVGALGKGRLVDLVARTLGPWTDGALVVDASGDMLITGDDAAHRAGASVRRDPRHRRVGGHRLRPAAHRRPTGARGAVRVSHRRARCPHRCPRADDRGDVGRRGDDDASGCSGPPPSSSRAVTSSRTGGERSGSVCRRRDAWNGRAGAPPNSSRGPLAWHRDRPTDRGLGSRPRVPRPHVDVPPRTGGARHPDRRRSRAVVLRSRRADPALSSSPRSPCSSARVSAPTRSCSGC